MGQRALEGERRGAAVRRILLAVVGLAFASLLTEPAVGEPNGCQPGADHGGTDVSSYMFECVSRSSGTTLTESHAVAPANSPAGATYSYVWLPNCPGALPSDVNVGEIDCPAAHSCVDPQLMSMSLYAMQLTNASGQRVNRGWSYLGSQCRNPADAGPTRQPRVLTWTDVLSAIKQVGVPGASVQGPAYTLVNLDTTFYTQAAAIDRPLTIIGYNVEVHVQPSTYTWHWGDGSSETTNTPGHPYPSTDITHTYIHATDANQPVQLSVDVTYTARYRGGGGGWQAIPDTLTIAGQPRGLPIKQASAVLVADN